MYKSSSFVNVTVMSVAGCSMWRLGQASDATLTFLWYIGRTQSPIAEQESPVVDSMRGSEED